MKQTPQIRLVFTLTRRDRADFDRDAVTRGLGILPTRSCPPTPGKGKVQHCGREIHEPDEQMLRGKEAEVRRLCEEYNLYADLSVRVFAASNDLPELILPDSSVAFWASVGATVSFDFYLD